MLTKAKGPGEQHLYPHMLPDNKTVLFTVGPQNAELTQYRLAIYSFGDDDYQIILDEEGYNAVYSRSGHILYGRSDRLMGVPFDLKNLKVTGVPAPVLNNVSTRETGSMSYALSSEGTLAYVPGSGIDVSRSVINVDLSGKETGFMDLRKHFDSARYSPDGKYVAFLIEEQQLSQNIWIYHIDGGALSQLTFYQGVNVDALVWSPDSKSIAYAAIGEDSTNSLYIKRRDGTGTAQKIYTSPLETAMAVRSWSSDGQYLMFHQINGESSHDLFIYSFNDSTAKLYFSTPALEVEPQFSPNGKWIAYMSNKSGTNEVYVRPFPESTGGVWKISNGGGDKPLWSPDGKKIYYRRDNEMYSVDVTATDKFSKGNPEKVFEGNYFWHRSRRFDIHPDGDRFIMIQSPQGPAEEKKLLVIQNFFEELKRLVPVEKN